MCPCAEHYQAFERSRRAKSLRLNDLLESPRTRSNPPSPSDFGVVELGLRRQYLYHHPPRTLLAVRSSVEYEKLVE